MRISESRTPLTALRELTTEQIRLLNSFWVTTAEEFYACQRAVMEGIAQGGENGPQYRSMLQAMPAADVFKSTLNVKVFDALTTTVVPKYGSGLIVTDDMKCEMLAASREYDKSVKAGKNPFFFSSADDLPHEVRLMDDMPEIRDQKSRGTCSAFASVALCEFMAGDGVRLSPQYIYCRCKERDGRPDQAGTSLDTVQETLHDDGVCTEDTWAYNPEPVEGNEGQGPVPEGADEEAKAHRVACRALTRNSVPQFKRVLAAGYPVVVGVVTFRSWTCNAATARTGKITMPFVWTEDGEERSEPADGGHAMCIVGYVDDKSVPGGGYFIVRNSWGEEWAGESVEAPGHALMPYEYVAKYSIAAFTAQEAGEGGDDDGDGGACAAGKRPASGMKDDFGDMPSCLRPFARRLTAPERDKDMALLPKGTVVLGKPGRGSPIFEYSQANRSSAEFADLMNYIRFRPQGELSKSLQGAFNGALSIRQQFCAKVEDNLSRLTSPCRMAYPAVSFSWRLLQMPLSPRIWENRYVADFSEALLNALVADACGTENVGLPGREWRTEALKGVSAKIRRCSSLTLVPPFLAPSVYVVEAFGHPFAVDGDSGALVPKAADDHFLELVMTAAGAELKKLRKGQYVFYTVGIGTEWTGSPAGIKGGDYGMVVSSLDKDGNWSVCTPGYLSGNASLRDFVDRLVPITDEDRMSKVKSYVDDHLFGGFVGAAEVARGLKKGAYRNVPTLRKSVVARTFLEIARNDSDRYVVEEHANAEDSIVIRKRDRDGRIRVRPYRGKSRLLQWIEFHAIKLSAVVIGVILWRCRDGLMTKFGLQPNDVLGVMFVAVFIYLGSVIQNCVNNFAKIEKE